MNRLLLSELLKLEKEIERHVAKTKAEMDSDPTSALIEVHLKFHDFLAETKDKPGARSSVNAMERIDALMKEKDRHELAGEDLGLG